MCHLDVVDLNGMSEPGRPPSALANWCVWTYTGDPHIPSKTVVPHRPQALLDISMVIFPP